MPTTYTHQRFGAECAKVLSGEAAVAARARRGLFNAGAHGPDLLFYYRAPLPSGVARLGSRLHHESARSFFAHARPTWLAGADREGMAAYLFGFLAHFALDSACHGFVNSECSRLGVTHNRLEAVWDARLMLRDGRAPSGVYRGEALSPSRRDAAVIAPFYCLTAGQALAACRGQARAMRILYSPRGVKKKLLRAAISLARLPGDFGGLFIDDEIPPGLCGALDGLDGLYAAALEDYREMAPALMGFLDGGAGLPERFGRDFE